MPGNTVLGPFPVNETLTGIAVAYRNDKIILIAEEVLPRVPVETQAYKYWLYGDSDNFRIPDTLVGRTGVPGQVEFKATETSGVTKDYGLDEPVPAADVQNAPRNHDPLARAAVRLTDLITLAREKRVAAVVFAATSYATGMKVQLSGTSKWTDKANSLPMDNVNTALDTPLIRPNVLVFGYAAWNAFRVHPQIVQAIRGNNTTVGMVTRREVADLFEVPKVLVGAARYDASKKGQASAPTTRLWGPHCAALFIDPNADTKGGVTFGFSPEFGGRIAGSFEDKNIGLRGGTMVRVGESVDEKIVADKAGYYIEDAA